MPDLEPLEALGPRPGAERAAALPRGDGFRSLSKRIADVLGVESPDIPEPKTPEQAEEAAAPGCRRLPEAYERVDTMAALDRWIARVRERGYVAVDTETTSLQACRPIS
ncbi:MAG: hypothetical protein R3D59_08195 [Paracoccaceae bacterium]